MHTVQASGCGDRFGEPSADYYSVCKQLYVTVHAKSYANAVRDRMSELDLLNRDVAAATGYTYEYVRKVVSGQPVASIEFNEKV